MDHYLNQLQALSDPTRFRLSRILNHAGEELCICELVDILQLPQYAVSRAAGALRRTGVLKERRSGKLVYYRLSDDPFVERLMDLLATVPPDDDLFRYDFDRLRWRMEIRDEGKCVVTYPKKEIDVEGEEKQRVLFICVHNSARSQIAEEYLRRFAGDLFEVESAGLTPGQLNPFVVDVLAEDGIDISGKTTQSVFDLYRSGRTFAHVITVCSREAEENCPIFPGPVHRLNWPFPDPSQFSGSSEQIKMRVRELRDVIREEVAQFVTAHRARRRAGAT